MKKIFIQIFIIIGFLNGSEIIISPLFYSSYEPFGGTWSVKENNIFLGGWGVLSEINFEKIHIYSSSYNNRYIGITHKPNSFSKEQGLSWWKSVDSANNPDHDLFDFDVSNMKLSYEDKDFTVFLGKFNRHWGPGNSSITISNKSPSFVQFGFNWIINSKINFEYFHGSLRSLITDSTQTDYYNQVGSKKPNIIRFIAGHRVEIKIFPNLNIGANELVIYGVRNIDLMYCLPFAPFISLQQYLGDLDNIQWSVDFNWKINKKLDLYGAFLIDEWRPATTFDTNERNWFAYQFGIKSNNLFFKNDEALIEYTWTDHRIYRHRFSINDFYNHGYPIGFWGGPHAEELFLNYSFEKFNLTFDIEYSFAKRGELSNEMLANQYSNNQADFERFSNICESIELLKVLINKNVYKGLNIHVGLNIIDWKNGWFDPFTSSNNNLVDVSKKSLFLGLSYNFDINKQKPFINDNSISLSYD